MLTSEMGSNPRAKARKAYIAAVAADERKRFQPQRNKVRGYTTEERGAIAFEAGSFTTETDKVSRLTAIISKIVVDAERYREAAETHPDRSEYYHGLATSLEAAIPAWQEHYAEHHGIVVPYSGTEGPLDMPVDVSIPVGVRADLPA